jgi:hypothetical protein
MVKIFYKNIMFWPVKLFLKVSSCINKNKNKKKKKKAPSGDHTPSVRPAGKLSEKNLFAGRLKIYSVQVYSPSRYPVYFEHLRRPGTTLLPLVPVNLCVFDTPGTAAT